MFLLRYILQSNYLPSTVLGATVHYVHVIHDALIFAKCNECQALMSQRDLCELAQLKLRCECNTGTWIAKPNSETWP